MLKIKSCMNAKDPLTVGNALSRFCAVSLLLLVLGMIAYLDKVVDWYDCRTQPSL